MTFFFQIGHFDRKNIAIHCCIFECFAENKRVQKRLFIVRKYNLFCKFLNLLVSLVIVVFSINQNNGFSISKKNKRNCSSGR